MKRIYIFPRYSGNENSDWYQKAKLEIMKSESNLLVIPLSLPNWDKPEISKFLSFIENEIPMNGIDSDTYFIGHSVGCRAALVYLNELQMKNSSIKIGGLMCIAGWWSIDKPWPQLAQWINVAIDYNKIQEICNHNIVTLLSENDPYTSDYQKNMKLWKDKLNAKVSVIPNVMHFNNEGYDEIMNEIKQFISK